MNCLSLASSKEKIARNKLGELMWLLSVTVENNPYLEAFTSLSLRLTTSRNLYPLKLFIRWVRPPTRGVNEIFYLSSPNYKSREKPIVLNLAEFPKKFL